MRVQITKDLKINGSNWKGRVVEALPAKKKRALFGCDPNVDHFYYLEENEYCRLDNDTEPESAPEDLERNMTYMFEKSMGKKIKKIEFF